MLRTILMLLLSALATSCAAKSPEVRLEEHKTIFACAEQICKERAGIKWMKIIDRENERDLLLIRCWDAKDHRAERYVCQD